MTDAFSLNTIFITSPSPHPRDETDIQTKAQTQGRGGNRNQESVMRKGQQKLRWGISWLTQWHKSSTKPLRTIHLTVSYQFLLISVSSPDLCLWYKYDARPPGLSPVAEHCVLVLCLSFRHQTTIDRDSILSPPRPAPHKTLIARKLWRTQIAPARMSCKPPQKLLCSPKPTSIVEKNWNIHNYCGQLFHFSLGFWIFYKSNLSRY